MNVHEDKILLLTSFGTADGVAHALAAGATGALMKNADFSELVASIRTVASGGRAVSPEIEHFIEEDPPVQKLTPRQMDILASVVRGLTNDDIARQFSIQRSTHGYLRETRRSEPFRSNRHRPAQTADQKLILNRPTQSPTPFQRTVHGLRTDSPTDGKRADTDLRRTAAPHIHGLNTDLKRTAVTRCTSTYSNSNPPNPLRPSNGRNTTENHAHKKDSSSYLGLDERVT